jgi:hypothetical protein
MNHFQQWRGQARDEVGGGGGGGGGGGVRE